MSSMLELMIRIAEKLGNLDFQNKFDILLEMRVSGIAKQGHTMLYGKSQIRLRKEYCYEASLCYRDIACFSFVPE